MEVYKVSFKGVTLTEGFEIKKEVVQVGYPPNIVTVVGFKIGESTNRLVIAQGLDGEGHALNTISIPQDVILEVEVIDGD